ncbi:hypothetical protein FE236_09855 [Mariprofundus erugo]|uniref:Uncharacterized protein n=1 Tax=Mariprofundus erugo TaxID=2528639 RepID=A0A5R9GRU2_9PROT|nr:hypothetical protein [Mariprofundus erugo]TLS68966.1 hypothetical protein FEF65_00230 [Mariprofundus erugo]TLS75260.1 hypothetical protein FE236_09855 [Mariprofundus erugo]
MMSSEELATVMGYSAKWYQDTGDVLVELSLLNGKRKSLGRMDAGQAAVLLAMLGRNGKKLVTYKDDQYMQVSEYYKFR